MVRLKFTVLVCIVPVLLGCGGISLDETLIDERLALDPNSSEFAQIMEAYPAHIAERGDPDYFFWHFGKSAHRNSESLKNAASQIIPALDTRLASEDFAGVLLLIREDGYTNARNWFDNYESNPAIVERLAGVISDASKMAPKSQFNESREQAGGDSTAFADRLREYAFAELIELEMPLTEPARSTLVYAGFNSRTPSVLAHLQSGLPASGTPLTPPSERQLYDPDPDMMEAFVHQAGVIKDWDSLESLEQFVRENVPQASAAWPLAIARYFDAQLEPPEAFEHFAQFFQNDSEAVAVSVAWLEDDSDVRYRGTWDALMSYANPQNDPERERLMAWLADNSARAISDDSSVIPSGGKTLKDVERREMLGKLKAILDKIAPETEADLQRIVADVQPRKELDRLALEYLVIDHLSRHQPARAAKAINARLTTGGVEFDGPIHMAAKHVLEAPETEKRIQERGEEFEWRGTFILEETLIAALDQLSEGDYDSDIAAVYLTLLASPFDSLRDPALHYSQTYFDRDSFVSGLFGFMVRKAQFGLAELARYESAIRGFGGVEEPLVRNLNVAIDTAGNPEEVYWALKVLSLDVLDEIGTAAAVPVLERLARDTGAYTYQETKTNPTTGEVTVASEETIRFADRANAILEKVGR